MQKSEMHPVGQASQVYRRDRGWGTGPDVKFTDFQQHPATVFLNSDDSSSIMLEEGADGALK